MDHTTLWWRGIGLELLVWWTCLRKSGCWSTRNRNFVGRFHHRELIFSTSWLAHDTKTCHSPELHLALSWHLVYPRLWKVWFFPRNTYTDVRDGSFIPTRQLSRLTRVGGVYTCAIGIIVHHGAGLRYWFVPMLLSGGVAKTPVSIFVISPPLVLLMRSIVVRTFAVREPMTISSLLRCSVRNFGSNGTLCRILAVFLH